VATALLGRLTFSRRFVVETALTWDGPTVLLDENARRSAPRRALKEEKGEDDIGEASIFDVVVEAGERDAEGCDGCCWRWRWWWRWCCSLCFSPAAMVRDGDDAEENSDGVDDKAVRDDSKGAERAREGSSSSIVAKAEFGRQL